MSIFTNPPNRARDNAAAYTRAVCGLVAERDPLDVMQATPALLSAAVAELTPAVLATPEASGKWSIRQVVQHLADSELVFGYRIRRVLAEDGPVLEAYDQDLWVHRLGFAETDVSASLRRFGALRTANLRLLRAAGEGDFRRIGRHEERGEQVLADMLRLSAGHDLLHLRQINRIRGRVSAP